MIISVSGTPGSGKSTVCDIVAKNLGLSRKSAGFFMRSIAKKKGLTLLESARLAVEDPSFDRTVDNALRDWGRENDDFVVDSRLAFYFIPTSFKVFLKCNLEVAAQRIFSDKNQIRKNEADNSSVKDTLKHVVEREDLERKRYLKYYGVDFLDESHYDLVVDTVNLSPEQVANIIISSLKK
ncbi:AAA family ATPase [Candidatus Woesearchaeota archaeon]|nr:AAA family ATPase [Candidatus Woesearchaeota archaeon]